MKHVSEIIPKVTTEMSQPSIKDEPVNTGEWAKFLKFDTFDDPPLIEMLEAAARFTKEIKNEDNCPWLVLLGTSGIGKSHLAKEVWKWWWGNGRFYRHQDCGAQCVKSGQFCFWADFIQECREQDSSRIEDLMYDDLVILDDIGAGADARGWMSDKIYRILEKRLDPTHKKATLITANMSLEQLADIYDVRIADRLLRRGKNKVIDVEAQSYSIRDKGEFKS